MPHRLIELRPQHHAAIRMRIEGRSTEAICDALEVKRRTVYLWFSDPLIKAELRQQLQRVNDAFAERFAGMAHRALDELEALLHQPTQGPMSPALKLQVSKEILDRSPATAKTAQKPGAEEQTVFGDYSDEELRETAALLARSVRAERANGSP